MTGHMIFAVFFQQLPGKVDSLTIRALFSHIPKEVIASQFIGVRQGIVPGDKGHPSRFEGMELCHQLGDFCQITFFMGQREALQIGFNQNIKFKKVPAGGQK